MHTNRRRRKPLAKRLPAYAVVAVLLAGTGWGTAATVGIDAVVDSGTPGVSGAGANTVLGIRFEVTQSITIDSLGHFDAGGDGLDAAHEVGLWAEGGTLLASATVDNSGISSPSASGEGDWIMELLAAPVVLTPGTYRLAGHYNGDNNGDGFPVSNSGSTSDFAPVSISEIDVLGGVYSIGPTSLAYPTSTGSAPRHGVTLGIDFAATAVPDGGFTLALLGCGLLLVEGIRRSNGRPTRPA